MFHFLVVVRPLVGREELQRNIDMLPAATARNFSYEIVHDQSEPDISATNLRKDVQKAFRSGFISETQRDYIVLKNLYNQRPS
jgi:hypothetical protein